MTTVAEVQAEYDSLMERRLSLGRDLERAHFAWKAATDKAAAKAVTDAITAEIIEVGKELRSKRVELEWLLLPAD
jgi:hypothetical protein